MILFYFVLTIIETIGLFIYNASQTSSPQEQLWMHYSLERLGILAALFICVLFLVFLAIKSWRSRSRTDSWINAKLASEKIMWLILVWSILAAVALVALLIQPENFFGDYLAVFQNLKPIIYWLLLISMQTFMFAFVRYAVCFSEQPQTGVEPLQIGEMAAVLLVFIAGVLLKIWVVLPNGFGMLKDVGETKYLYMLQYFNEGIFLRSATEFTTHYPPLYPLLLTATYSVRDYAFEVIKLINALAASSLVFPLYFLARRFFNPKTALVIIVIASLIPFQFELPVRLLSENLYFPLLFFALYLVFTQPADFHYRLCWDGLTGFVLGLLYLTRYISLALIPFLLLAWWLKPFANLPAGWRFNRRKVLHAAVMLSVTGITFLPWVLIGLDNNLPVTQMLGLGIAADTNPAQLTAANLLKWIAFYGAYFILLAAPVLNLLGITLGSFRLKNLADERNRWILTVLILLAAFSLAIVRHSWRADYNLELPKRLMGRYVVYFVPLFILSAFLAHTSFQKDKYRHLGTFLLWNEILPLLLVGVSYMLVIQGSLLPVNSAFIHPLISIDGYYIELLGPYFFPLLFLLFTGSNLLLWYRKKGFTTFLLVSLALYYVAAQPAYLRMMAAEQVPQQLGQAALDKIRMTNRQAGQPLTYLVLLPTDLNRDELDDVAWTLFIRHPYSEWRVGSYSAERLSDPGTDAVIVLLPLDQVEVESREDCQVSAINGQPYCLKLMLSSQL